MPKRKACSPPPYPISLTSLDAALDLLACETFSRLHSISSKFECAARITLAPRVVRARWDEAVRRYWLMKSMDALCCNPEGSGSQVLPDADMQMKDDCTEDQDRRDEKGRLLPCPHPGAVVVHDLCSVEEKEWRSWTPKVGDVVLVERECGEIWPGKIIDKKSFFQGRTVPRGNHFFPVRIYSDEIEPTITVKSRLIPLHLRPTPQLLCSPRLLSAYHHAVNPASFDLRASSREAMAAQSRSHPGVGADEERDKIKADKESWNNTVNWVMNERRGEKMRMLAEERERRLREIAKVEEEEDDPDGCPSKRARPSTPHSTRPSSPGSSIFGPGATVPSITPRRTDSPSLASYIRPGLSVPQRPLSPRRFEKRRSGIFTGLGEYSPRGRGTWTPPRILPSGDETAPQTSPVPSGTFDFVSPLGPVSRGRLTNGDLVRRGSLEAVKEEVGEEEGWTLVSKRCRRAGSAPCAEKAAKAEAMDE